ncbi:diguanylate cyclase [Neptunicella marina]|uniref:diguanylate cyclase n=1 Tax=Neptunicella marina TaxID=2125989 RepID=A0A8J6M2F6_9ALTE|nr:diguanylate cyclase [Neptunicella marina]MBC3766162.1 diguanylate cyclase [Neptunicella marina]
MQKLRHHDLESLVQRLDLAIENHRLWVRQLMRILVCQSDHAELDKSDDAHTCCDFGRWYYGQHPEGLLDNPTFKNIEFLHHEMHRIASGMLYKQDTGQGISEAEFETFYSELDVFVREVERLKAQMQKLLYLRDPLTGAYNRATLKEELYLLKDMLSKQVETACILMLDLDNFKGVNDRYGHAAGDEVLKAVAEYIQDNLRTLDKFFRYGGEEFLVTLVNSNLPSALATAERMREGLCNLVVEFGNSQIKISASIGVALIDAESDIKESLEQADKALYTAKRNGRNRVELWSQ